MEKDLDKKLYNDYVNGEKQAFEYIYKKYKNKIQYFIFNIVKDYHKAEDLTQETFIYVMQNKMKENSSFKYYIYLVAKSKAYNYLNIKKRRNEINEQYVFNETEQVEKDILDMITSEETKKELLSAIEELDEKYKNVVYLINIEGLSYKETAKILGQTLQNTKTLLHRGKKQLKKILLKKGFSEMNKVLKIFIIIICTTVLLSGIVYASVTIYKEYLKKQEEIKSNRLFDLGDGITTYEIDLMANDMTWNKKSGLYHKIISNEEEYVKYKSRVSELPNLEEINFAENFVVIIATENKRQPHEKDLIISEITADETTTHIIMKQRENPNDNNDSNIIYAIVDKSLLREQADVSIEYRKINVEGFTDVNELPKSYSVENAISDGCVVLENNKLKSNNIEMLDKFIEKTEKGENATIRVYSKYTISNEEEIIYIKDIEYLNGIYYLNDYNLKDSEKSYFSSHTKFRKGNSRYGITYSWIEENESNGTPFIIIQDY
mgnify:CR=1 FL=1